MDCRPSEVQARRDPTDCGRNGVESDLADGRGLGLAARLVFEGKEGTEERALVVETDLRGDSARCRNSDTDPTVKRALGTDAEKIGLRGDMQNERRVIGSLVALSSIETPLLNRRIPREPHSRRVSAGCFSWRARERVAISW